MAYIGSSCGDQSGRSLFPSHRHKQYVCLCECWNVYYTLQHYIIYHAEVCIYITITTRIEIITKILFIQIQIIQNTQVVPLLVWDTLSLGKEKVRKLLFIIGIFCKKKRKSFEPKKMRKKVWKLQPENFTIKVCKSFHEIHKKSFLLNK